MERIYKQEIGSSASETKDQLDLEQCRISFEEQSKAITQLQDTRIKIVK